MKKFLALALTALFLALGSWLVFSWYEADTELRTLCEQFERQGALSEVRAALGTGEYIDVRSTAPHLIVDSPWNLRTSSCRASFTEQQAASAEYRVGFALQPVGAWVAVVLLAASVLLHLLLGFGAPLGRWVWFGRFRKLPRRIRMGSFIIALLYAAGLWAVLERAHLIGGGDGEVAAAALLGILTALFGLNSLANAVSTSAHVRRYLAPATVVLYLACLVVVLGP